MSHSVPPDRASPLCSRLPHFPRPRDPHAKFCGGPLPRARPGQGRTASLAATCRGSLEARRQAATSGGGFGENFAKLSQPYLHCHNDFFFLGLVASERIWKIQEDSRALAPA